MASTPVTVAELGGSRSTPQHLRASANATSPLITPTNNLAAAARPHTQQLSNHHDGRIRNAIPSKLKGKTDAKKGNFSVMLIDLGNKTESTERDAAAKRTSESTALRAKLAFQDGYVPLSQRKVRLDRTSPPVIPPAPPPAPFEPRREPLTPSETKTEQARLLTLLRSLHPVMVVDQVCKALAFFGGIPGAPSPPKNVDFPVSNVANGSGSLFVGWLAEIFPPLGTMPPAMQKRPRGRPKGSKTAKLRRDKGFKKGSKSTVPRQDEQHQTATAANAEDGWVDVDETLPTSNDMAQEDTVVMPTPPRPVVASAAPIEARSTAVATLSTPIRRRGRPKGSKNRPKETNVSAESSLVGLESVGFVAAAPSGSQEAEIRTSVNTRRAGPGRPKGSKNKPKHPDSMPTKAPAARPALLGLDEQHRTPAESTPIPNGSTITQGNQPLESGGQNKSKQTVHSATKRKRPLPDPGRSTNREADPMNLTEHTFQSTGTSVMSGPYRGQNFNDVLPAPGSNRKKQKVTSTSQAERGTTTHNISNSSGQSIDHQHKGLGFNGGPPQVNKPTQPVPHNQNLNSSLGAAERPNTQHNQTETTVAQVQPSTQSPAHILQQQYANMREPNASGPRMPQPSQPSSSHIGRSVSTAPHPPKASAPNSTYKQQPAVIKQHQKQQQQMQSRPQYHHASTSSGQLGTPASLENAHLSTTSTTQGGGAYKGMASMAQQSPFSRVMTAAASSDASYRNNNPRLTVQQNSSFQSHQPSQHSPHANGPGMAVLHGFTDSSFLDLGSIDTSGTQTALGINTPSYGVAGSHIHQRNAGTLSMPFASPAGGGHHGFEDTELGEAGRQERVYQSMSRRRAE